jgi:hypothetical protein
MEVSSLASVCVGRGLANQLGVNPEASELMIRTYDELRESFRSRAAYLQGLVALLEGKK